MGKIRVKTLGEKELEKKQQEDAENRRLAKKQRKAAAAGHDEGQVEAAPAAAPVELAETEVKKPKKENLAAKVAPKVAHHRGKKYVVAKKLVEKNKIYGLDEAVGLLKKTGYAGFDETIELHLNLVEGNVKGEVSFPHGFGKEVRVVVADDALLDKIDEGVLEFDILIATPAFMPKLVKYARVLGPKGLMPNPKNGTVVEDTKKAVEKFMAGATRYKAEPKFPLLHMAVGKMSFPEKHLLENIEAFLTAVKTKNVTKAFLTSTMGPAIEIRTVS